jgi:hypothetical protein
MERITYFSGMWYIVRRGGFRYDMHMTVGIRQSGTISDSQFAYRDYNITGRY